MNKYEIINQDGMRIWLGQWDAVAWHLALICERYPTEFFRLKIVLFEGE